MMVERRTYHHSTRRMETVRMVVVSSFYHHWMPRYSAKRQRIGHFINVSPIISATNNGRRTKLPPFEPSRCDDSNGGGFVLLSPLNAEIIGETFIKCRFFDILLIISVKNAGGKTKLLSFDSSYRDGSDGSNFVLLTPLDAEIIGETSIK